MNGITEPYNSTGVGLMAVYVLKNNENNTGDAPARFLALLFPGLSL